MMGILPQAAAATHVDIPTAGGYISSYAIGVCAGTLILVFGRKIRPKNLIVAFMVIALVASLFLGRYKPKPAAEFEHTAP